MVTVNLSQVPPHKRHNQCGICSSQQGKWSQNFDRQQPFGYETENQINRQFESEMMEQEMIVDNMRDFSSTDDILSHYFSFNPKTSRFFQQQQDDQSSDYFWQQGQQGQQEEQHGWSRREEREWELEEKSSKSDKWDQFDDESINAEFNSLYSPLSQVDILEN